MKRTYCRFAFALAVIAGTAAASDRDASAALQTERLRCEYAIDPLGVDVANPRLSWIVTSDDRGQRQTAYQILVASSPDVLDEDRGDLWDSGKFASDHTLHIHYKGAPLTSSQQAWWKVRAWDGEGVEGPWSATSTWTTGVLRPEDWRGKWIVAPWSSESVLIRRDFRVRPGLKRALVHICGLGHFELSLNGKKSGENLLAPGWTKYNKTALYETHDVTAMLREGDNCIGLTLGDGMYHSERRDRFSKFQGSFGPQRAYGQVELVYEDGSQDVVATDESWKVAPGPVTYNDIYGGEDFDARRLPRGWNEPGFEDGDWANVVELVRPSGELRGLSASAPPLRAIEVRKPVDVRRLSETRDVIDLGQNASFMPRIRVTGPAGSSVRLTHAEVVHRDGSINRDTCGGNRGGAWWQYTKATDGEETWFPQFFYAGCRYLQLDKMPAAEGGELPQLADVEGVVVHSVAEPLGEFECSNDLLNRIHELVRWAQRSNMVSVLTDCPHREKLGWLEQYHLNGPSIRYEFDVSSTFVKGMRDMADSQTEEGLIPNIAPEFTVFPGTFRAASEWGASFLLVPWQQYQFTGDPSLIEAYYPQMQKYMEYLASKCKDNVLDEGLGDWYDLGPADRPGVAQLTPPPVTATAFYYYDAKLMARFAKMLGKTDDEARYAALADEIRARWLKEFRNADRGTYATNSQCSNALALVMELAEEEDRDEALAALVKDVRDRGNAMTAGDVGFRYLLLALAEGGHSDVIYDMINQDEKPGYGFQLKRGATALTEAWDANNNASHNHFMLGQIIEWYYRYLVGIDFDASDAGFKRIVIRPTPVGDLKSAHAAFNSVRGRIACEWRREGERFLTKVSLPANTTAIVYVPSANDGEVKEGDQPAPQAHGVTFVRREDNRAIFELGSGDYEFWSTY